MGFFQLVLELFATCNLLQRVTSSTSIMFYHLLLSQKVSILRVIYINVIQIQHAI